MQSFYQATITGQEFTINFDKYSRGKQLEGKYVFLTNVSKQAMTKEAVRNEYPNLHHVEHIFKESPVADWFSKFECIVRRA